MMKRNIPKTCEQTVSCEKKKLLSGFEAVIFGAINLKYFKMTAFVGMRHYRIRWEGKVGNYTKKLFRQTWPELT